MSCFICGKKIAKDLKDSKYCRQCLKSMSEMNNKELEVQAEDAMREMLGDDACYFDIDDDIGCK